MRSAVTSAASTCAAVRSGRTRAASSSKTYSHSTRAVSGCEANRRSSELKPNSVDCTTRQPWRRSSDASRALAAGEVAAGEAAAAEVEVVLEANVEATVAAEASLPSSRSGDDVAVTAMAGGVCRST